MDAEDGGGAAARMNVEEGLTKPLQYPSGVQKRFTQRGASAPSLRVGVVGGVGGRGIKSVLQFSLYFFGTYGIYMCTYKNIQELS